MGENEKYVFNVGCPRIDLVADELKNDSQEILKDLFDLTLALVLVLICLNLY